MVTGKIDSKGLSNLFITVILVAVFIMTAGQIVGTFWNDTMTEFAGNIFCEPIGYEVLKDENGINCYEDPTNLTSIVLTDPWVSFGLATTVISGTLLSFFLIVTIMIVVGFRRGFK